MKKSFVAMALILVLCMSQFLIGNAEGKAIDITDTVAIPSYDTSGAYTAEEVEGGVKFTATSTKGGYSAIQGDIAGDLADLTVIKLVVEGKAGLAIMLKVEANGTEQQFTLEGGEQVIEWAVNDKMAAGKLTIFVNPGVDGCTADAPEWVTVKSAKLCSADYVEPAVPETPETGDSFNMVPAVMMVLAAFVFVAAYAKKRAF